MAGCALSLSNSSKVLSRMKSHSGIELGMIRSYAELNMAMSRLSSTKYAWLGLASELRQGNPNPNLGTEPGSGPDRGEEGPEQDLGADHRRRAVPTQRNDHLERRLAREPPGLGEGEGYRVGVGARVGVWVAVWVGFGLVLGYSSIVVSMLA